MRHVSRMFVVAAQLRVPFFAVVLRKGYGLGAMAMTAGGFACAGVHRGLAERRVRRDGPGRRGAAGLSQGAGGRAPKAPSATRCSSSWSAQQYAKGKAINMAATLEIDAVIDPAETARLAGRDARQSARLPEPGGRFIDPW